jgi:hypothetical protein
MPRSKAQWVSLYTSQFLPAALCSPRELQPTLLRFLSVFLNYDELPWAARRLTAGSVVQRTSILRDGQSIVTGAGQP